MKVLLRLILTAIFGAAAIMLLALVSTEWEDFLPAFRAIAYSLFIVLAAGIIGIWMDKKKLVGFSLFIAVIGIVVAFLGNDFAVQQQDKAYKASFTPSSSYLPEELREQYFFTLPSDNRRGQTFEQVFLYLDEENNSWFRVEFDPYYECEPQIEAFKVYSRTHGGSSQTALFQTDDYNNELEYQIYEVDPYPGGKIVFSKILNKGYSGGFSYRDSLELIQVDEEYVRELEQLEYADEESQACIQKAAAFAREMISSDFTPKEPSIPLEKYVVKEAKGVVSPGVRTALLVANDEYEYFPDLENPIKEATDMKRVLTNLDFDVTLIKNASREDILFALEEFNADLNEREGIAFFHYGGHAVQVDGENYLIPVQANIPDELRVRTRAIPLDEIMNTLTLSESDINIAVLDACRNNPLPSTSRSSLRGLSVISRKPPNSIVIFSAQPGAVAHDGVFTPALVNNLQIPNLSFSDIVRKTRMEVYAQTNGEQLPATYDQLFSSIYLSTKE